MQDQLKLFETYYNTISNEIELIKNDSQIS